MKGSCLCGKVTYEVAPPIKVFQYCHCSRCRKFTGSAHASNFFVPPEQFHWLQGEEWVGRYEEPKAKYYATCFCKNCGSSLPWLVQGGKNVVIPAGTLDEDPGIRPTQSVFWGSRAPWYESPTNLPHHEDMPPRKG
ncbi:GFA family protein [Halioxenophilus sp. WMMB6]|uniref:GFA family protein n=1 Tax=Halioxenophilus sp. WMMB6 TaxID=3073815 RepID=UPI00295F0F0C|nr:GFA family protein [Halioxenophilus sp. WMMB6]